jgi:cystathionine beta-synthase
MRHNPNKVFDTICEAIGETPLIRLHKVPLDHGVVCQIFAKAEFLNIGGSSKDRIALQMVETAEEKKLIKPGDTLVEATSGNTGIGLALVALVKDYKLKVVCSDKVSCEKIQILKNLGAEVFVTSCDYDREHPCSSNMISRALGKLPGHYLLDQYNNESNVLAHYRTTAEEIYEQMEGKIDYVFCGAGTCGTITGIGKKLHEKIPKVKVIGIDLIGSVLSKCSDPNLVNRKHKIEGIGQMKVPSILDYNQVQDWVKIDDKESFETARDIISKEGLLVGGSSGSCLYGALQYLKANGLEKDQNIRCVVVFPDSVRNYMTKFFCDRWMVGNGFYPPERLLDNSHPLSTTTIQNLPQAKPSPYFDKRLTINDCFDLFKTGVTMIPIREKGELIGVVTQDSLIEAVSSQQLNNLNSCYHCISKNYLSVN